MRNQRSPRLDLREVHEEISKLQYEAVTENKPFLRNAISAVRYADADELDLLRVINSMEDALEVLRKSNLELMQYGSRVTVTVEEAKGMLKID